MASSSSYGFSIAISLLITLLAIGAGLSFKSMLASSRQGTLIAGGLASVVFTFVLTAISNWKMMNFGGAAAKCGLAEASISLLVALIYAGSIHRVATTITLLFCGVMLFFLNGISHTRYHSIATSSGTTGQSATGGHEGKKKRS